MSNFNRGNTGPGRRRDLGLMPGASAGEGTTGNVIPRGTTQASIRRGQALLRMMSDRLPGGQQFSRGTTVSGRRRNFAMMAGLTTGVTTTGVELTLTSQTVTGFGEAISWTAENFDNTGWWSSGTTMTCSETGTYDVAYSFDITPSATDGGFVRVTRNGTTQDTLSYASGATSVTQTFSLSLTAGDTVVVLFDVISSTSLVDGLVTITIQ